MNMKKTPYIPKITSNFWHISNNPDLGEITTDRQEVVDHTIFQSRNGKWHLWACIRGTKVGRLLFRWEGESLESEYWEPKGIAMRADKTYGESIDDWNGEEWIQAPYVFIDNNRYYMVYGGHSTETGECQICLAYSLDGGRTFQRYRNRQGYSRIFIGPGEARDPMIIKVDNLYYCYYAGGNLKDKGTCKVYCRTSPDLIHWSVEIPVCWGGSAGNGPWSAECPFVVFKDGYYYLFRTSRYQFPSLTHVYRSDDPLDFGLDTDAKKITTLQVAAPEIIQTEEGYFISTVEDLKGGVQLAKLGWEVEYR